MIQTAPALLDLVAGRRGHFCLESGHHSGLWFDLDPLFADGQRIDPFVLALADAVRPFGVAAVCGPLVGGAFLAQLIARAVGAEFCFTERLEPAHSGGMYQTRYRLPSAFAGRLRGKQVAVVDDVMSAGSALRGTRAALESCGAVPVVVGALLVLGSVGVDHFARQRLRVETIARADYLIWQPADCPLCAAGLEIENVADGQLTDSPRASQEELPVPSTEVH